MTSGNGWFYLVDGNEKGPISSSELVAMVRKGGLGLADQVRRDGTNEWLNISQSKKLVAAAQESMQSGLREIDDVSENRELTPGSDTPAPRPPLLPREREPSGFGGENVPSLPASLTQAPREEKTLTGKWFTHIFKNKTDRKAFIGGLALLLICATCVLIGSIAPPRKLSVDRALLENRFKGLGFDFTDAASVNGVPRKLGQTKNNLQLLELLGAADELNKVTLFIGLPNDNDAGVIANSSYMMVLTKTIMPNFGGIDWLSDQVKKSMVYGAGYSNSISRDGVILTFSSPRPGVIFLTYAPGW